VMVDFVMPQLGADMRAGTLVEWRKRPGDAVAKGEIMAEVETDKGEIEVEAFASGVVDSLLVNAGDNVPVGTPLATIREGESAPGPPETPPPAPVAAPAALALVPETAHPARVAISPSARRLASELGLDIAAIAGSGPKGRIIRRDVQAAAAPKPPVTAPPVAEAPPAPPPPAVVPAPPAAADDKQARMREAIAAAMAHSKREIPHFYLRTTIDLSAATSWLADENERRPVTERLLYGVLLIKAVALALREVPELNATWQDGRPVRSDRIHVGVAVSLRGGGLIAPALHDTDQQPLDALMRGFRDLVTRARAGALRGSELSDPTITLTSLGERGVEEVYGVIVPPQVAIVGFGKIVERPWVSQGAVLVCPVVTATLSADHRVTDGHRASLFLAAVDRLLQEPSEL
jgi:pyruvate dehydrogenase E2 component (dihydrolipoyllysine-residue acetyltransferase)